MNKPSEILAVRFAVSRETAKYFLLQVQKSFKLERPPHALILEFMNGQHYEGLPKPWHVAKAMNDAGLWAHAMNAEPRDPEDDADIYGEYQKS
jgi:hypothetical protein